MRFNLGFRAFVYLAVGLNITFKQGRGITWAIAMLALFGLGLTLANIAPLFVRKFRNHLGLIHWLPEAALAGALMGAAALNPYGNEGGGYGYYVGLITAWGVLNLVYNSASAWLAPKASQLRKDAAILAGLNGALGLLFAFAPLGAIPAVGFFGAYLVLVAVHLGISATSASK